MSRRAGGSSPGSDDGGAAERAVSRSGVLLDRGLDFVTAIVTRFGSGDWERPTPCAGWTARDLLGHLATSMGSAIAFMHGRQPTRPAADPPGDLVDGDSVEFWRGTVARARNALRSSDLELTMETPLGRTAADALAIPVIDLYVHAWDLGVAIGVTVEIPTDLIDYAHSYIDPLPEDLVRGDERAFAPQTRAPAGATPTERFIAWTGRQLPQ